MLRTLQTKIHVCEVAGNPILWISVPLRKTLLLWKFGKQSSSTKNGQQKSDIWEKMKAKDHKELHTSKRKICILFQFCTSCLAWIWAPVDSFVMLHKILTLAHTPGEIGVVMSNVTLHRCNSNVHLSGLSSFGSQAETLVQLEQLKLGHYSFDRILNVLRTPGSWQ